jgi:hypothetical protein
LGKRGRNRGIGWSSFHRNQNRLEKDTEALEEGTRRRHSSPGITSSKLAEGGGGDKGRWGEGASGRTRVIRNLRICIVLSYFGVAARVPSSNTRHRIIAFMANKRGAAPREFSLLPNWRTPPPSSLSPPPPPPPPKGQVHYCCGKVLRLDFPREDIVRGVPGPVNPLDTLREPDKLLRWNFCLEKKD